MTGRQHPYCGDQAETTHLQRTLQETLQRYGDILQEARLEWDEDHNCYRIVVVTQGNHGHLHDGRGLCPAGLTGDA